MRATETIGCTAVILAFILFLLPVNGEADIYGDVLRLHVVAQYDSERDQSVKLRVRDAVTALMSEALASAESVAEAEAAAAALLPEITAAANVVLASEGVGYTASARITSETYPTREYASFTLPAGEYRSVIVTLGGGEGRNWWCVLFPRLCLSAAVRRDEFIAAGFTPEEYRMITGADEPRYKIKFKVIEFLSALMKSGSS